MNETYKDIISDLDNYLIRLDSMSFIMLVNKTTGQYTNLYKKYGARLDLIRLNTELHPIIKPEEE